MKTETITTKSGKTYELRDNLLDFGGRYDNEVDAVIFKKESGNFGPAYIRIEGKSTKAFTDWISLADAKKLATERNLPFGIV